MWGFRYYADPPEFTLPGIPEGSAIVIPSDGGMWVIDLLTGIRYRRVTMDDMPKGACWNTRGKGKNNQDGEDDDE